MFEAKGDSGSRIILSNFQIKDYLLYRSAGNLWIKQKVIEEGVLFAILRIFVFILLIHFYMKTRNVILVIILLVLIDQGIKLIVYTSLIDTNFGIIPGVLDFKPTFNSKYSFVNDSIYKNTGMDAGLLFHIILFAIIWFVLFVGYKFFKSIDPHNKTLDVSFAFFTSAVICAYLGMLVWEKGILDFLHFKWYFNFVCDLKDIYINCFVVLFLISAVNIETKHNVQLTDLTNYLRGLFK